MKNTLIIVEESRERTPKQASVILSKELRDFCKKRNIRILVLDKDIKDVDATIGKELTELFAHIDLENLPVAVLINDEGKISNIFRFYDDVNEVIALLGS